MDVIIKRVVKDLEEKGEIHRTVRKGRLDSVAMACSSSLMPISQAVRALRMQSMLSSFESLAVRACGTCLLFVPLMALFCSKTFTVAVFICWTSSQEVSKDKSSLYRETSGPDSVPLLNHSHQV